MAAAKRFRVLRGILKTLLWTVGVVLLLGLLVFGFLQTSPGKSLVKGIVLDVLNGTFRGRIELDELDGFLPFEAELVGVRAYDPEGKLVLSVDRLTADFEPLGLLASRVHLSNVRVTKPFVDIFDDQNRIALLRAFEPRTPSTDDTPSPWILVFEKVHLADGRIDSVVPGEDVSLEDLQLDLSLGVGPEGLRWPKVELRGRAVGTSELVEMLGGGDPSAPAGLLTVRTSGGLVGDTLRLDTLEVLAGEHAIALEGVVGLEAPMVVDVDITDLRVALDRLPASVRGLLVAKNSDGSEDPLATSDLQGRGHATLDRSGEATVELAIDTPYGLALVEAAATLRTPDDETLRLLDWATTVELLDVVPPPALREQLPTQVRSARADIRVEAFGKGTPLSEDGTMRVELTVNERAPHDDGALTVVLTRIENDPRDGASTFELELEAESLDLQPWLAIAGEPEILGEIAVFYAHGTLALPLVGMPRIAAAASFDASASGRLVAADKIIGAPHLAGSVNVQWLGVGAPSGRVDLAGVDLGFDLGGIEKLDVGFDVRARSDGAAEVEGRVKAAGLRWDKMTVATLELPLNLVIEGIGSDKIKPSGHIGWRATGVDLGEQRVASSTGDFDITNERDGMRVRGVTRTGKLFLGGGINGGAKSAEILVDAWVGPGADGAPVGGPISARVSGDVIGPSQGTRSVEEIKFDDLLVAMPRGPTGPIEVQGLVKVTGVASPEANVDVATVDVDMSFNPATTAIAGDARIDVGGLVLPEGRRIDQVHIDASATPDGRVAYRGSATRGKKGEKDKDGKPVDVLVVQFVGTATIPGRRRGLDVTLESLQVGRLGDLASLLVLKDARYGSDGWITLAELVVRPSRMSGALVVSGRFRPRDGAIEATVDAGALAIPEWALLMQDAFGWAGIAPPAAIPKELGGSLGMSFSLTGTLARPTIVATLALERLEWGDRKGAGAKVDLHVDDAGVRLLAALQWHEGGNLSLGATLPAHLSLAPFGLEWRDTEPFKIAAAVDESDMSEIFAWADELSKTGTPTGDQLRQQAGVEGLDGKFRFDLLVDGTPADPKLYTTFVGAPLDVGRWKNGSLTFEGSARGDASTFRMELADSERRTQAQIDIELPFGIARAIRKSDPVGWMLGELETKEFSVDVDLPRFVISDTPLYVIAPDNLADLAAELDLTLAGTLRHPIIVGTATLTSPEASPVDVGASMTISTKDDVVDVYFAASRPDGETLIDGSLALPDLGKLLTNPSSAKELLDNPKLVVDVHSADIPSFDFWELNQSIGDIAVQMFPDGRVMLDVTAKGSPRGLVANVSARVRTVTPKGVPAPATTDSTVLRRNAADDVRLAVLVGPDEITLNMAMIQDVRSVPPTMVIQAKLKAGLKQFLNPPGGKLVFSDIGIEGKVVANEFRVEGFASSFRDILGISGGQLGGELLISGTVSHPRFAQSLTAQFQPLVVAPLGWNYDFATVTVEFSEGTRWKVTVGEIYDETRTTSVEPMSRCGVVPPARDPDAAEGTPDFQKLGYLAVAINGTIPSLDPKTMTLEGCIGLRDFPALSKRDMKARVDGELKLAGTLSEPELRGKLSVVEAVLAPKLTSKTVRPIGNPLDVTIVRGPPVPPPVRAVRNPYKTGILIDIDVAIPKKSTRLEPSLTQLYGEVRALLYPSGDLRIRTAGGELGLVGTIDVPSERVMLYGRDFTVDEESKVVFTGDMTSDPQLFFTARYNIAHIKLESIGLVTTVDSEVVVRVTGTPTQPRLKFSSTPAMDETNILSVIALGVPAGGGEGVGDAVSAQLFTAVMGMATLQFARDFQQRLALDVLRIEARSANPADSRLTVGKRLAENLTLYYYLDLSAAEDEDENSASLEYRLTRYLSILGRGGDSGDVGLELNLRFQD